MRMNMKHTCDPNMNNTNTEENTEEERLPVSNRIGRNSFLFWCISKYIPHLMSVRFCLISIEVQCHRWVKKLTKVLEKTLHRKMLLPERKIRSMEHFLELFPEARRVFLDGSERSIRRPKNPKVQEEKYSGKKKRHTVKNVVISDENKLIKVLSKTYEGKKHDFAICKEEKMPKNIPQWIEVFLDLGFEGFAKEFPHLKKIFMPYKKPKKKELPKWKKKRNKDISSIRVQVEHAIGGVKRYGIVSDTFRNMRKEFDDSVMLISCGLWNYHKTFQNS